MLTWSTRATLHDVKDRHSVMRDRLVDLLPAAIAALSSMTFAGKRVDRKTPRPRIIDRKKSVFRTEDGGGPRGAGGDWRSGQARLGGRLPQCRVRWRVEGRCLGGRWWQPEDVTPHVLRHTFATWDYCLYRDLLGLKDRGDCSSVILVQR